MSITLFTCPGCSNACQLKVPIPELPFDFPAIPALPAIPTLPEIPTLPKIPTAAEIQAMALAFAQQFAGMLPTITSAWQANHEYSQGATIQVDKPMTPGAKGERKTLLAYKVQIAGTSGATIPTFTTTTDNIVNINLEVTDNTVTWKFVKEIKGLPGSCPNSGGGTTKDAS